MPVSSPNATLLRLGRGVLSIAEWVGSTPPTSGDYEDVGGCSRFDLSILQDQRSYFDVNSGVKNLHSVVLMVSGYGMEFDLREVSLGNLARFLLGTLDGQVIHAATALSQEYALKFESDNPSGITPEKWEFWKVRLIPRGPFSLVSPIHSSLVFEGRGLVDRVNHPSSPFFDSTLGTTTTTTA